MANLVTIVRATHASVNALDSMSHFAREASDCSAVIARNYARVAAGQLRARSLRLAIALHVRARIPP